MRQHSLAGRVELFGDGFELFAVPGTYDELATIAQDSPSNFTAESRTYTRNEDRLIFQNHAEVLPSTDRIDRFA